MVQTFFIIRHHYKWEACEISTTCHVYPTPGLAGSNNPYYALTSLSI